MTVWNRLFKPGRTLSVTLFLKEIDFLDPLLLFAYLGHKLAFKVGTVKSDLEDERRLCSR